MVATAHIEKYRAGNSQIVDLFTADLHAVWQALDLGSPRQARDVLLEIMPELTDIYGEQAALISAEWFENLWSEQADHDSLAVDRWSLGCSSIRSDFFL